MREIFARRHINTVYVCMRGVWEETDNDIDVQILLLMYSLSHCCDEKDWGEVLATGFQRGGLPPPNEMSMYLCQCKQKCNVGTRLTTNYETCPIHTREV